MEEMVEDYPRTLAELESRFSSEQACREYLFRLRWPEGFRCSRCDDAKAWPLRSGLWQCSRCGYQISVTAGTIFQDTRTPLTVWFRAMWWVTSQKNGVSALGLQRVLGLGSYQTAWAWLHKLRRAMVRPGRDPLEGIVEIDETLIGGVKPGKGGRGADGKALVAIGAEVHESGRVRMRRIANASADTLTEFVLDDVARAAEVHTDGWGGYNDIGRYRFAHVVTNISASGEHAHVVMPEVHRVASLLKRWLLGTHQGAVSHDQLIPRRVHLPL